MSNAWPIIGPIYALMQGICGARLLKAFDDEACFVSTALCLMVTRYNLFVDAHSLANHDFVAA